MNTSYKAGLVSRCSARLSRTMQQLWNEKSHIGSAVAETHTPHAVDNDIGIDNPSLGDVDPVRAPPVDLRSISS